MLLKIIKLPFKVVALPIVFTFGALYVACAICLGFSAIIMNLLSGFFFLGAVAGWIIQAPSGMVWQAVGLGVFFAIAPHIAQRLLVKLAGIVGWIVGIVFS